MSQGDGGICAACNQAITRRHYSILCFLCDKWNHNKCVDLSVPQLKFYESELKKPDGDRWSCLSCLRETVQKSQTARKSIGGVQNKSGIPPVSSASMTLEDIMHNLNCMELANKDLLDMYNKQLEVNNLLCSEMDNLSSRLTTAETALRDLNRNPPMEANNLNIARNIEDRANCPNSVTDNHTGKKCFVNFDEEQHKIQTSSMVKELASTTENNEGLVPDLEDDQSINSDTDSRSSSKNPYSSDDSIRDPDYESSSSSSSSDSESENNNVGPGNMHNLEDTEADPQKKAKKRKSCPENWRKNILKRLRNSGKSYVSCGKKHQQVAERKKGPPCNDTKCRLKCSLKILGDIREAIFTDYWNLGDIEKQRCFLMANMEQINPKYRYVRDGSYRKPNHAFYFTVGGKKHRVCKLFFRTTLAMRGKHGKHTRVDEEIKDDVRNHIDSIPRKESHYSREGTSREFIDGGKSLADIHRDYVAISKAKERHYANYLMFSRIFNTEYNISFFIPKKDQCEDCIAYFNASEEDKVTLKEKYDTHLREKELSRQGKQNDKKNNDDNTIIAVYDLQAVLQCPRGDVSSFYYTSKLNVFNFSIYEMKTNTGRCFVWDDSEANRGVCEIGTCVFKYLQNLETYATEDKKLDVIFYSDNCCGQQINRFMFGMYSYAVQNLSFINSITHKFLIKGHAQNEGGSMHSVIEKQIKKALKSGSIYVPQQYITLMRTTKKSGQPYIVTEVSYEDILNLKRSHYYRI
ncbi:unnamed protein product [Ceutorhynchus assimilis]|uniref:Zinc finger PHD-type domain-containing protein n=1 Tax=Ceutorhynchus assimilis TaxID=467358 RepID=A0A9N9MAG1_9CUCU|nr:unnamed protein product [Ceutorhynchus assimilis]